MLPLVLMCIFLIIMRRLMSRSTVHPKRLLLLRTFGSRGRSTRLMRSLANQWRWVGSVELVAAPDIATEVLDPDEFLDFLRGRLWLRFINDRAALHRQLANLDLAPDRDRRYRVNEFLCHVDNWKPVVEALVGAVDAFLIDLRGFNPAHLGLAHELERLVALVDLRRVIALVDESTDPRALQWTLDRRLETSPDSAPIRRGGSHVLQVVVGRQSGRQNPRLMVEAAFVAASDRGIAAS